MGPEWGYRLFDKVALGEYMAILQGSRWIVQSGLVYRIWVIVVMSGLSLVVSETAVLVI